MPIDPNARFERQRQLAKQEQNAESQQAKDAVARRFAAMGRTNSGAALKTERQIDQQSGDALQRRLQSIQDSEDTEGLRRQEIDEGRKYQTSEREASQLFGRGEREASQLFSRGEREGSQGFMADQSRLGREFARGERLGGQEFASGEAAKQRGFQTSERLGSQQFASGEREAGQRFAAGEAQLGRDWQHNENLYSRRMQERLADRAFLEQVRQFDQSFEMDKRVTDFNMDMARTEANKKDIFGRLGEFGTDFYRGWGDILSGLGRKVSGY